jgi:hypothetical protein
MVETVNNGEYGDWIGKTIHQVHVDETFLKILEVG